MAYLDIGNIDRQVACYWYCRSWKSWGVAIYNAYGDQQGEADWYYAKADAVQAVKELAAKNNCLPAKLLAA